MTPSTTHFDPQALNDRFEQASADEVIAWAAEAFGNELVMSSSFGDQAAVLIHLATRVVPRIRIIFVDTGYLFPETHLFMEQIRQRFDLNVWTYRTRNDPIAYLHKAGEQDPGWREDVAGCCGANKNEPFERAFKELHPRAWLRGTRREQAETRRAIRPVEWFKRYDCWAISPMLNWSRRDVGMYMKQHQLPWHPLVEEGYMSIGCNPRSCTAKVLDGADPRSGRWAGQGKIECGLNVDSSMDSAKL